MRAHRAPSLVALSLAAISAAGPVGAAPLARDAVPEPLRPWIGWVLHGREAETCPFLHASAERQCVWPARLELELDASGGRFTQQLVVAAESDVPLPGGRADQPAWPEDVRVDGAPAPVVELRGRPALRLPRGSHRVTGRFVWTELPPLLAIPPETGIVELRIAGRGVPFPRRDSGGRLWLREAEAPAPGGAAEDRVAIEVHRRVTDGVPMLLETRIALRVSGSAREELLGRALPAGFVPTALSSPIPARVDPDGRLRAQLRPGRFDLRLFARHEGPAGALALPEQPSAASWDASEVWAVETRPALRQVEVEGAPAVDPTQTELPVEWRTLPAYRLDPGTELRLVERQRGAEGAGADRLSLARTWHLDFDGGGATVVDRIAGELRETTRLEMGADTDLGRAAVNGVDQPVTRLAGSERLGLELPLGAVAIDADSRVEARGSRLPAVGWDRDFDALEATLALPPGWRLLHVSGADGATPTWVARWTLLDLFVVMVVAMATLRLFGARAGALALATLALTYTEPGAPRLLWIAVLAAEALRRVVPAGRLATAVRVFRLASLAGLVLVAVPFAVAQVRAGLHPALERPGIAVGSGMGALSARTAPSPEEVEGLDIGGALRVAAERAATEPAAKSVVRESRDRIAPYAPDPDARVQTGPGRPEWRWQQVALVWSGPVERDQELRLWLIPPWLASGLAFARTGLLAALVWLVLAGARPWPGVRRGLGGAAAAALLLAALAPARADAEMPGPELLEELRARLLAPPDCHPSCASAPRLLLAVAPDRLDLRLAVDVAADTAVPLPGGGDGDGAGFVPDAVAVDGRPAAALRSGAGGGLWLRLAPGSHTLLVSGPLPSRATVEIALPLRPERVEIGAVRGWTVQGVSPDGRVHGALQLVRETAGGAVLEQGLEPTEFPPFVSVERTLFLGLDWEVHTRVQRIAPPEGAIVLEVPLLPGEAVTTAGVRVQGGRALATLPPGIGATGWNSVLAPTDALRLEAPREVAWTEVWRVDASPIWRVLAQGIPPIDAPSAGRRLREWRPWPGEGVDLAIDRPEGAGGSTLTVDRSALVLRPGLRATDAELSLALRSSQGGQHAVTLPEGARLTGLAIDGRAQPLRQEDRRVPLPIAPGAQRIDLAWREPVGISAWLRASEVDLGLPSVNAHVSVEMPPSRWTLLVGGPRLGPSVLFWPVLFVVAALSLALGRVRWTPLRAPHWFGLGLGLTQAPLPAAALVVAWLLALGWRGRLSDAERSRSPLVFDALQVTLVAATIAALAALALAIRMGLLGAPEMQIAGNGSDASVLRWYQDRSGAVLPRPWVLSVSLWAYRGAMLAWSLWVAQALLGWLRWGYRQWSSGGSWARLRAPRVSA